MRPCVVYLPAWLGCLLGFVWVLSRSGNLKLVIYAIRRHNKYTQQRGHCDNNVIRASDLKCLRSAVDTLYLRIFAAIWTTHDA